ncbi:hypothetical protein R6Q59_014292 [Mikania micrantha]
MSARFSISCLSSNCHLWLLLVLALVHLCFSDQKSRDALCMEGERQALIWFKQGLIDEADRLASWSGEKSDCCKWDGIVCDNITGHVHEIHLPGPATRFLGSYKHMKELDKQRLGGHLSRSLLELKQLKHLELSCNDFKRIQIPSFIGSLGTLRYLNLSESNFGGMIPPQIGNISELRVLSLRNLFENTPTFITKMQWLSGLRWLHHLDVSMIDLSKATDWFQVINTLPSLVELHLSVCLLSDLHPHVPSLNVTSLSLLDISVNAFVSPYIPRWIFSLTSLVSLDFSGCGFIPLPSSIYSFRNLTSLESLNIGSNYFMNSPLVSKQMSGNSKLVLDISNLSNLKFLDVSDCGVSSSGLHSLHNLTSLLSLYVSENQLTKAIPNSFGNLCNLRDLDLSSNNFGNAGLTHLLKSFFNCKSPSLESLDISQSGLSGPIPNSIGRLSSLKTLSLFGNMLNGSIPDSIGQLSKLNTLFFFNNSLTGVVTEAHFTKLVNLKYLFGEGNNLTLKLQVENWTPPFQLQFLFLNSWGLGPSFPLWLQSQRDLKVLDISNTGISSPMPPESFWRSLPNLTYLDMSQNNINDTLALFLLTKLEVLDLNSNQFIETLPSLSTGSLMPIFLDLSNNSFMGSLHHFLCFNGVEETQFLSLGYNHLSGVIPECWNKWSSLRVLILKNNNLSGEIPRTLGSLLNLQWLNMHGNNISGSLPSSLMNLSWLRILQLGKNELVGSIPPWIGTKLTFLRILNLRSNNLDGNIPDELCYLSYIQIIDLAKNNLSGIIPRCFNNFSVLTGMIKSNEFDMSLGVVAPSITASDALVMKGQEYTYKSFLRLVTLLDLSSNNFFGPIPSELTSLQELKSLNLSRNQMSGRIPEKIGDMNALESFDLSINNLSGELPLSLSRLNFLSSFNVSCNNFTGRIPVSTQLQSFNESSFLGNQLCGAPLSDQCAPNELPTRTTRHENEDDGLEWGLIINIVLGFVIGFWIILAPLIVSTSWRTAYFCLMSRLIKVKYKESKQLYKFEVTGNADGGYSNSDQKTVVVSYSAAGGYNKSYQKTVAVSYGIAGGSSSNENQVFKYEFFRVFGIPSSL